jgi:type III secretion system regulator LcrR
MGFSLTKKNLPEHGVQGWSFTVRQAEIVYYIEDDDETVIIPFYGRRGDRAGLQNAFRELIWFVGILAERRHHLGLSRVRGLVRAERDKHPDALSTERISEFYTRLLGAHIQEKGFSGNWLVLDLKDFRTLRQFRNHPAPEISPDTQT